MANRFIQAPNHGGQYRAGQPTIIVIHSLEAPARRGLAYSLATGWLQNQEVSPHSMTDPGETVDVLTLDTIGWQCGNGNQVSIGLEVTGYAAWSFDEWTTGDAFAAVRLDAKRAAEVAKAEGIPLRWLSLQQIRSGEAGFCTHADVSATLGGTNHTDPGTGFPYAIFMQMVQQWTAGADVSPAPTPNPQPGGGTGGAAPKTPEQLDEEEIDMSTQQITDAIAKLGQDLIGRLDSIQSSTNRVINEAGVQHLSLVKNTDDGAIYAYGPGQFDKISSMDELSYGRDIGIYSKGQWLETNTGGIEVYRGLATEGSGAAPKG